MSSFLGKKIDQKLSSLLKLKKLIADKWIVLQSQVLIKVQNHQKYLKFLKKELKERRLSEFQITLIGQQFIQQVDNLLRQCYWKFRLERTDFQALFVKLKFNEEAYKKHKHDFDEIMNFQTKKQGELLINCKEDLLIELKNQLHHFDLKTILKKADQILSLFNGQFESDQTANMKKITSEICKNYHIIPFHNFTHAFGVFLSFYTLANKKQIRSFFTNFQMIFSLFSCLSHDIQHQGNNTLFQIKTNTPSAIRFGKLSVMQKMHLSTTLDILIRRPQTNKLFESLSAQKKIQARKIVSKAILATDMSKHYEYVQNASRKLSKDCPDDRSMVIQILIHACDIDNPSLDFQNYMHWAHLVCIEFYEQTIKQQDWNVQVTDFLKFDSLPYFYKNQINFANTIVLPLWESISTQFPSIQNMKYVQKIKKNLSLLSDTLRRNSEPALINKSIQKYLHNKLSK